LTGNKIKELGDVQWFRNSDRTIIDENVFCLIDLQKFDEKLTECQKDLDNCTTNYEETIKKYKNQTENNAKIRDCNLKVSEETAELNIIKFKLATYQNYTNSTFENSLKKSKEFIRHHAEKKETYLLVSISFAILLIIMSIVVSLAIPKKNPNLPKVKRAQVRFSPSTKLE
jgi:ATP-dependent Zn protease